MTPSATTNRLYSNAGSLYWNGSLLGGGSVGNWTTHGANVWRTGGNVGIGTTSPFAALAVVGNGYFTGALTVAGISAVNATTTHIVATNRTSTKLVRDDREHHEPLRANSLARALSLESNGLAVGTNQLIVSGGDVGIGTTSPFTALSVSGSAYFGSTLTAVTGTLTNLVSQIANGCYNADKYPTIQSAITAAGNIRLCHHHPAHNGHQRLV